MRRPPFARVLLAAALAVAAACVDQTQVTAPNEITAFRRSARLFANPVAVQAIAWGASHAAGTYTASAVIGALGGTLEIPECDMTLTVPAGAIPRSTEISATCLNDGYVGYSFQPHGLTFNRPVIVTQGLSNIGANPGLTALFSAYLDDQSETIGVHGKAFAIELPQVSFGRNPAGLPNTSVQFWTLQHFSRYILASGATEPEPDSTQAPQPN